MSANTASETSTVAIESCGSDCTICAHVPEEPRLVDMDAQQLRELVHDDDEADAGLEPDQDGLGDEVGHETEPQHRRDHQHHAHHDGESRGGCHELRGTASGATAGRAWTR